MGNLASSQLNTQSDPELVRRQILAEREKQLSSISNPQQQLAARLGGLLGGGLVNVAQDRGFFDVNDPLLNKVTQIQGIYQQVASQIDPTSNPEQFYRALQSAYSEAGLGREALAAAQEGQKAKVTGMDMQLKEAQLFKNSPELLAGRIEEALKLGTPQGEAEANRLANLNARITQDRELELEAKQTAIAKDKAYIAYQTKLANDAKFEYRAVDPANPLSGHWKFDKSGGKEPEYVPVPASVVSQISPPKTDDKKGKPEGKLDKNKYMTGGDAPASPATAPARETTWSGVSMQPKPVVPLNPVQERDFAIQRAYPTIVVSTLDETTKAQLAQQLGL